MEAELAPEAEAADRCPYERPFHWHFSACPAFLPRLHLPTDIRGKPLHAHWTCAHLVARKQAGGGFYPGCELGGPAERDNWAARLKDDHLIAIRLARVELSEHIRPHLERVRAAIGDPYAGLDSQKRAEARQAWSDLNSAFEDFVDEHPELFTAAGIDPVALRHCWAEATAEFATRAPGRGWLMAESIVSRYPWPIQAFFRPDLARLTVR